MMQVEMDTLIFNSGAVDADGTWWYITDFSGWEGPSHRQTFHDITTVDGVAIGDAAFSSRTLTFEGVVKATSETLFWKAYNAFIEKTSKLFAAFTLKVYEGAVVKRLAVVQSSPPRIQFNGVGTFVFQVELLAPYPVKLNDTLTTATYNGGITATNNGKYQTFPVVTMNTAGTPVFGNSTYGTTLGFTGSLLSGTVIDFRKKTVTGPAGQDFYSLVDPLASGWWPLMVGANTLTRTGSGTSTLDFRDAWL